MTERKKNASQSQMTEAKAGSEKSTTAKSARTVPASQESATAKSARTVPASQESATAKSARTVPAPRREPVKIEAKAAPRREAKGSANFVARLRGNRLGRFIYDAYYELRHKVTWPTLREARNMTAVVIALSVVVGGILAAADFGLHRLFLLIIGGQ